MLTLNEFKAARSVLSGVILNTSLIYSPALSKSTGNNIYIKPENMQVTGAYKIRGAYYKISTLSDEEKAERQQDEQDKFARERRSDLLERLNRAYFSADWKNLDKK